MHSMYRVLDKNILTHKRIRDRKRSLSSNINRRQTTITIVQIYIVYGKRIRMQRIFENVLNVCGYQGLTKPINFNIMYYR